MSIVCLIVKQEMVLNLLYLFPECKDSLNVLYTWYFTNSELQTNMDMICQKWDLYQAC